MANLRTLVTLPVAAAAALIVGSQPASAAPITTAPVTTALSTAPVSAKAAVATTITPSPILDLYLQGGCDGQTLKSVVAMQRVDWMWAPLGLDNPDGKTPLPKVLVPATMLIPGDGSRGRHDMAPGVVYTAPGPKPAQLVTCTFEAKTPEGPLSLVVTGTVVTIPRWLDALLPPIQPPPTA